MPRRTSKTEKGGWGTDRSSVNLPISPSEYEVRELVAIRAYEIFVQRDAAGGDDLTDWLTAEAEVLSCLRTNPMYEQTRISPSVNLAKKAATKRSVSSRARKPMGATASRRNSTKSEAA